MQVREGSIVRSSGFALGPRRGDVASAKGITAVSFTISAGQSLSPRDIQEGLTSVHVLWGDEDRRLPAVASCRKRIDNLAASVPADLKVPRGNFSHVSSPVGTRLASQTGQMSTFEIPVGTTSGDGVTLVGGDGHLFLRGGGNPLQVQYSWGTPSGPPNGEKLLEEFTRGWQRILKERARSLGRLGIPYRQIILPEKNSVLSNLLPLNVETPTPLYRRLVQEIRDEDWFVESLQIFREWDATLGPSWMKVDSHFTSQAAMSMSQTVLRSLNLCEDALFEGIFFGPEFEHLRGNMGWRLVGFDLYDRLDLPSEPSLGRLGPAISPTSMSLPASGGHVGTRLSWSNERAPIDAHVLVFGSSSFGRGQKANQMSWWFSRLLKRFTMVWDPSMDMQIVEELHPDAVVCQNVERFLMKLPGV